MKYAYLHIGIFAYLFNFFVNSYFLQDRVEFFKFQSFRIVLFVFYRDVTAGTWLTTCFVLSTFHNYLYTVSFLCHFIYALNAVIFFLRLLSVLLLHYKDRSY